jgi:hypothetical protein
MSYIRTFRDIFINEKELPLLIKTYFNNYLINLN